MLQTPQTGVVSRSARQQAKGANAPFRAAGPVQAMKSVQTVAAPAMPVQVPIAAAPVPSKVASRRMAVTAAAIKDGQALDRPLRVAVIGGGPSGACAAGGWGWA
jgi:geranylgeranyl reductase